MSTAGVKVKWPVPQLGDLCQISIGRTPPRNRRDYWGPGSPWLSIADMNQGRDLDTTAETITDVAVRECNCRLVSAGTVLLSFKLSIGKVGIAKRPLFTNEAIAALPIKDSSKLLPEFLYWALRSIDLTLGLDRAAKGLTLNSDKLQRILIPLPPLPEQRRIAEILDKAGALRAKRRAAISQLDTLNQSIFLDMFGDPATNPKGWPELMLGEVFDVCSSRRVLESQWQEEGVPFYRAREIVRLARDGYVDNDIFISEALFNELAAGNGAPKAGDLMVSAVGTLGACYQVRKDDRFYFKDASVLRFIPKSVVEPAFVRHAFSTDHVQRQVHRGSGSTVGTYTIARARQTRLYLPPLGLQRRFAELVERVQCQTALHSAAMQHFTALFATLQHRAFRGQL